MNKKTLTATGLILSSALLLSGCAGASSAPLGFNDTITKTNTDIAAVTTFTGIEKVQVMPDLNKDGKIGLDIHLNTSESNIEAADWTLLFKTLVTSIGANPQNYNFDVPIPVITPTSNPTETPTPYPVVSATPSPEDISFIILTGDRDGGSGEQIQICETSGFQQSKLECKDDETNSPYSQTIDWNWVRDTYK